MEKNLKFFQVLQPMRKGGRARNFSKYQRLYRGESSEFVPVLGPIYRGELGILPSSIAYV